MDAVEKAIDECIQNGILAQFLSKRRADVMSSILTEYDEEKVPIDRIITKLIRRYQLSEEEAKEWIAKVTNTNVSIS